MKETTTTPQMAPSTLDTKMDRIRMIGKIRISLRAIGAEILLEENNEKLIQKKENRDEIMVNLNLAYSEIENANIRLGKVKQALNEGKSIYDENIVRKKS